LATPVLFFFGEGVDVSFFQHAHVQLTQTGVESDIATACLGDDFSRAAGATEIATDDMGDAERSGAFSHLHSLLLTFSGQRTVRLALNTSLGVPLRFTVANKVYL